MSYVKVVLLYIFTGGPYIEAGMAGGVSMKRATQLVEMRRDSIANRTTRKIGHFPGISYLFPFLVKMGLYQ